MCGIFGFTGRSRGGGVQVALKGLQALEYRGYDSAGIAGFDALGQLQSLKSVGKVSQLARLARLQKLQLRSAITHTRWATHGAATRENAHPHLDTSQTLAVVHNGIVENFAKLRSRLASEGIAFRSETDTEVLVQLIAYHFAGDPLAAIAKACQLLTGSFAFAAMHAKFPDQIFAVARGSPLVLGRRGNGSYLASDLNALGGFTDRAAILNCGEMVQIEPTGFEIRSLKGKRRASPVHVACAREAQGAKGGFAHHMLKEIHEQPLVARRALEGRCQFELASAQFEELEAASLDRGRLGRLQRVLIIGCGTSWHAGCIGAQWLEEWARLPAQAEISSEFRTKNPIILPDTLVIAISQSGETADTLAAVRELKGRGVDVIGLCNSAHSSLAREVDASIALRAGLEVSVCSTKAFTNQLIALALLALTVARARDLTRECGEEILQALVAIPDQIEQILSKGDEIAQLAKRYSDESHLFYIGRRYLFPTALEGALKLKEISYINANGYASGELKHGPIALIGPDCPTVALAADQRTLEKLISNILEIKARNGRVLAVTYSDSPEIAAVADEIFTHARTLDALAPILSSVFGQLFAYYIALHCRREIDTPRNLAKSVTVE